MAIPGNSRVTATVYAACTRCQVARKRRTEMNRSAHSNHLRGAATAMAAMLAVVLVALAGAKPAEAAIAGFPEGHSPIAFENDGDIKVARIVDLANLTPSIVHLENLTPNTAHSNDVDPAVSPDGRYVAFASDRDGDDFEIYVANVFTGEVEQITDNTVYDYNPGWSLDGNIITYKEPLLYPEDTRIFGLRVTHEAIYNSTSKPFE
jgi:WD40 repeat protein